MSGVISFSYDDPNQVVVLPANLPGRVVRMARINDMIARLYCTDAITGQEVMWPDELEVWDVCGGRCRAVPVYSEDILIAWTGQYDV